MPDFTIIAGRLASGKPCAIVGNPDGSPALVEVFSRQSGTSPTRLKWVLGIPLKGDGNDVAAVSGEHRLEMN